MPDQPFSRNIELKARCADLEEAKRRALQFGARPEADLNQIDTYFNVPVGRLKIRQIGPGHAELIAYHRDNNAMTRASDYLIAPLADAASMIRVLSMVLGERGQVRKRRQLLLWRNVRIHLDSVEDLGGFIELEAVVSNAFDENASRDNLQQMALQLKMTDPIGVSYADLKGI
jgi:adenylate cyclase class IV